MVKVKSYVIGFVLSILLTISSYFIAANNLLEGGNLFFALISLAFLQLVSQLIFFLHLSQEPKPRWNLVFFISTFFIILIVIIGSIWIMQSLNYHMPSQEIEKYIMEEEMIYK